MPQPTYSNTTCALPVHTVMDLLYVSHDVRTLHTLVDWRDEAKVARKHAKAWQKWVARPANEATIEHRLEALAAVRHYHEWQRMVDGLSAKVGTL